MFDAVTIAAAIYTWDGCHYVAQNPFEPHSYQRQMIPGSKISHGIYNILF